MSATKLPKRLKVREIERIAKAFAEAAGLPMSITISFGFYPQVDPPGHHSHNEHINYLSLPMSEAEMAARISRLRCVGLLNSFSGEQ